MPNRGNEGRENFVALYEGRRAEYERFATKLADLLRELVTNRGLNYEVLEARTKTVKSFAEKIRRPSKTYTNPLREVTDLVGLRIVVFYLEDADRVTDVLEREFIIDREKSVDKGQAFSPHEFGYRSVHYVVSLRQERGELTEWRAFSDFKAEIQIRTVLQHAWASASRAFDYMREADIPTPLRRRLFRLAGMFELADEEFSSIRAAHRTETDAISTSLQRGIREIEVNLDSINGYLKRSAYFKKLVSIARRSGFDVETVENLDEGYRPRLVQAAERFGLREIADFATAVELPIATAKEFLHELRRASDNPWALSISFLAHLLLIRSNPERIDVAYLVENAGWSREIAQRVLGVANRNASRSARHKRRR